MRYVLKEEPVLAAGVGGELLVRAAGVRGELDHGPAGVLLLVDESGDQQVRGRLPAGAAELGGGVAGADGGAADAADAAGGVSGAGGVDDEVRAVGVRNHVHRGVSGDGLGADHLGEEPLAAPLWQLLL